MAVFPLSDDNAHLWRYINLAGLVISLVANFLSTAGAFGETNKEVTDNNPLYITPAGWAFSIWGIIYTLQLVIMLWGPFCCVQSSETEAAIFGPRVFGYAYWGLSFFNIVWCIVFAQDTEASMWITTGLILGMLACLLAIHKRIRTVVSEATQLAKCSNRDGFDIVSIYLLWLGFSLYAGWVTAATILNVTLSLNKSFGVNTPGESGEDWSLVVVVFAGLLYPTVAIMRRDPFYSIVGAWAALAIADNASNIDSAEKTPKAFVVLSVVLAGFSAAQLVYGCLAGGVRGYFFSTDTQRLCGTDVYQRLMGNAGGAAPVEVGDATMATAKKNYVLEDTAGATKAHMHTVVV